MFGQPGSPPRESGISNDAVITHRHQTHIMNIVAFRDEESIRSKKLMTKAEELTKASKLNKIAVISGIGVRNYYKKLGYKLEGTYMTKSL